jgi:glutamyl-tRNA synthetase
MARVRFAPSPTGRFHIGSARTALYNALLARQTGGQFILRIEDTDTKRSTPESLAEIQEAMRWLGLAWDEGPGVGGPNAPYHQLARKDIYQRYAQQLLASGHAYRCFCTPERLKALREAQQKNKQPTRYDGRCRGLSAAESAARAAAGEPFVIRFKTPQEGETTVHDAVRGDITIANSQIDDYILVKSDGLALYHLAAMVDDHEMGITHVFRGSEWLGTFPLHALIIRAFGWPEPVWCHLSVFLKPTGKGKMSKRDVTSEQSIYVLELREMGYLPEAINSWTALMGTSFGPDEELLTFDEMATRFRIEALNPSAARVNYEKLDDFNGKWIRRLAPEDLAERIRPFFAKAQIDAKQDRLRQIVPLIRERLVTLDDAVAFAGFFFKPEIHYALEALVPKGLTASQLLLPATEARAVIEHAPVFTIAHLEEPLRAVAEARGLKIGQLFGFLRVAITGQAVSPPLIESMALIGRDTVLARLATAIAALTSLAGG